jgi:hypothetical protein
MVYLLEMVIFPGKLLVISRWDWSLHHLWCTIGASSQQGKTDITDRFFDVARVSGNDVSKVLRD